MHSMKKITFLAAATAMMLCGGAQAQHVWKYVATGDATSYAVRDDGSLWTCGWNEQGQMGVPSVSERTAEWSLVGSDKDWKLAVGGKAYAFLMKEDGTLWAVGTAESGVQGTNTSMSNRTPAQIGTDSDWAYVAAVRFWGYTGFAIKTDGTLWGWGSNNSYQLCNGTTTGSTVPVQIGTDNDWKMITSCDYPVLAIKTDGTLWGWGNNVNGGLGIANTNGVNYDTPVQIGTDNDWAFVQAISNRTYAVKTDGTLWATGSNSNNILGFNQPEEELESNVYEFRQVTAVTEPVISVSGCEETVSVATGTNGVIEHVYMWGWNSDGALGDNNGRLWQGSSANIPLETTPVSPLLPEGVTFSVVSSGQSYSLALASDGTLYGWGRNKGGQLGDGTDYDVLQLSYYKKPFEIECPQNEVGAVTGVRNDGMVKFDGTYIMAQEPISNVYVYGINGQTVMQRDVVEGTYGLDNLAKGVYLLQYENNGERFVQKIVRR